MNDSAKLSHQESGQGPQRELLTPVPVIFLLNPRVTENKGFGASTVTLGVKGVVHAKGQVKAPSLRTDPDWRPTWYLQEFFSSPFTLVEG